MRLLYARTGWRGQDLRIAWAVAMRESAGQAATVTKDDFGLFQLNYRGWGQSSYWPADPLHAEQNAVAAFRIWLDHGWVPWGHNPDGSTNTAHYGNWSQEQVSKWITVPFREKYRAFPSACRAWLKLQ